MNGAAVEGSSGRFSDIFDPNTGAVQARVPFATAEELDAAVGHAVRAQQSWALVNPQRRARVGMVGINVPIPAPVAYHTFGGWERSAFGGANQHGMEGVTFWTKVKTVTARWPESRQEGGHADSSFVIPTMK